MDIENNDEYNRNTFFRNKALVKKYEQEIKNKDEQIESLVKQVEELEIIVGKTSFQTADNILTAKKNTSLSDRDIFNIINNRSYVILR